MSDENPLTKALKDIQGLDLKPITKSGKSLVEINADLQSRLTAAETRIKELEAKPSHIQLSERLVIACNKVRTLTTALAAAKEALEKCQRTFETMEKLKGYKSHGPQGEELDIPPNIVLQSCIQIANALARIAECEKETT